ncbi:modifier of mdg4-like isoform X2 [Toxorhynchites rutilus septentrionalis]|nr:modifier of mdg4-like isoform X2 [Toxorhynchites rutilus septentrionalis]
MQLLNAHRFVLANSSAYFSDIFDKLPSSGNYLIVLPLEVTANTMKYLLNYMYTGETDVKEIMLPDLFKAGKILGIRGLSSSRNRKPKQCPIVTTASVKIRTPDAINAPTFETTRDAANGTAVEKRKSIPVQARDPVISRMTNSLAHTSTLPQKRNRSARTGWDLVHSSEPIDSVTPARRSTGDSTSPMVLNAGLSEDPLAVDFPDDASSQLEVIEVKNEVLSEEESHEEDSLHQPKMLSISKGGDIVSVYCCRVCSRFFFANDEWKRHMQDAHRKTKPASKKRKQDETTSTLICGVCNLSFKSTHTWMEHVRNRHKL